MRESIQPVCMYTHCYIYLHTHVCMCIYVCVFNMNVYVCTHVETCLLIDFTVQICRYGWHDLASLSFPVENEQHVHIFGDPV